MLPEEHSGALLLLSSSTTSEGERATADPDGDVGGGLDSHHQQQHQHCCGHRNEQEEEAHAETDEDGDLSSEGVQFCKQGGTAFSALGTSAAAASLLLAPPRTTRRRVYVVLGLCTLVAVGVIAERRRQEHLTWDRLRKPFKMYEGRPKMPRTAEQYGGMIDHREVEVWDNNHGVTHVFAVGDWGATLPDHITFATHGGSDSGTQWRVAAAMKNRARWANPPYILNVGDNFYWGGIEVDCGSSAMSVISPEARHQFDQIFEGVYYGDGLDGIPWFSVLGNHDWGGRVFNNGWDQQIAYTWSSARWIMPAPYFMQRVNYVDQGFSIDYIFIDSNAMDAQDPSEDPEHNLCSEKYNTLQGNNKQNATCGDIGGPDDIYTCKEWFWNFWDTNKKWAEEKLIASREEGIQWQIMITHFPCGHESEWYGRMRREHGLDLLVTGHRHDQELWLQGHWGYNMLSGLTCFVTGGGGGITSEATPEENDGNWYGEAQYGFYDMTIEKDKITIDSIDYKGEVILTGEVRPCDAWCPL
mmetsp:Transcript_68786/g.143646  ORF Transcript_68786/g.143646 Transcript_68786/m.143646 type:complete len:527 (-) Transcript_68786:571-2151(-)